MTKTAVAADVRRLTLERKMQKAEGKIISEPPNVGCYGLVAALLWLFGACSALFAAAHAPTVLLPPAGEPAYQIAGKTFGELWEKVTNEKPATETCVSPAGGKLPAGDIILIGSDAVNPAVHQLILQSRIQNLRLRYGTDDYHILSLPDQGRTILTVAGAAGRSTIYAVYDFFRRRAGAEYFWVRRSSAEAASLV